MALSISVGSDGRITPKGGIIPNNNAGIGDLVIKSGTTYKVLGRGTTTMPTGYSLYGVIYGFVNGEAMICAPKDLGIKTWGAYVQGMPIVGWSTSIMRNGLKHTYAQMNTATNSNHIKGGSSAPLVLSSAYQATSLTKETFAAQASAEIKARYNTWEEYIRQTLRVNGAPGTCFGITTTNVKVHEFGRWMGRTYGVDQAAGTALKDCYSYGEGSGTWWLPSMYELAELMIDEHANLVNENSISGFGRINTGAYRLSSVLNSSGSAWTYSRLGLSSYAGFDTAFAVRPVTLLKL